MDFQIIKPVSADLHVFSKDLDLYSFEIILCVGSNDLSTWKGQIARDPSNIFADLVAFAETAHFQGAEVFIVGLFPRLDVPHSGVVLCNQELEKEAKNHRFTFVGVCSKLNTRKHFESAHLNEHGMSAFNQVLKRILRE